MKSKSFVFSLFLLLMFFAGCAGQSISEGIYEPNVIEPVSLDDAEPSNSPESTIRIPFSAKELCGQKCSEIKEKFEIIGFNRIVFYDANGKVVDTLKDSDLVESIKIGSNKNFTMGDTVSTEDNVTIVIMTPDNGHKGQRNGFNPRTNWTQTIGQCTFSIPSYLQPPADAESSENTILLSSNDTSSPVIVLLNVIDFQNIEETLEITGKFIDSSLSYFGDYDIDSCEDIQLQGYKATTIYATIYPDDGSTVEVNLVMFFVAPNQLYRVYMFQEPDSTFDYSDDFSSIIKSVVINENNIVSENDSVIAKGNVGDSYIEVIGWELKTNYSGKPMIVLTYNWTNNSKNTTNAASELLVKGFQGGVALEIGFLLDSSVDISSAIRDIKPGTTITVQEVFVLYDSETAVDFEISELLVFSSKPDTLVFSIPLGINTYNDENTGNVSESNGKSENNPDAIAQGYVGEDYVEVIDWRIVKDYAGKPALVITFNWTNNSEKTTNAASALSVNGFQGGIATDFGILLDSSVDTGSMIRDIKPGTTITVNWAITLYDTETDVEFEISDFWDWNGKSKSLDFTIHLK